MNSFSCVITGHRPTRFKFKYNEKDKRCQRIKKVSAGATHTTLSSGSTMLLGWRSNGR